MENSHISASGVSLDLIYRSLNRTILFQLSRPINTVAVQTTVLESLHRLTSNRSLVFGPANYDQEFLVCLCYCLLQLTGDPTTAWVNNPECFFVIQSCFRSHSTIFQLYVWQHIDEQVIEEGLNYCLKRSQWTVRVLLHVQPSTETGIFLGFFQETRPLCHAVGFKVTTKEP